MDAGCTLTIKMPDGSEKEWSIGAMYGVDNEQSLRAHVAKWLPSAELLSFVWWNPHCECDLRDDPDAPADIHAKECPQYRPAPNPACNRPAAFGASDNSSDIMAVGG